MQVLDTQFEVRSWYNENKAKDLLTTLTWIKNHSEEDDVILTTWILGPQVVTYANRKVIATSKVYPSQIKEVAERYRDISRFFFSQNEKDAVRISKKYNCTYIFLPKKLRFNFCKYIDACHLTKNKKRDLTDKGKSTTIIGGMLDQKGFSNFSLVYSGREYLVYKFFEDV